MKANIIEPTGPFNAIYTEENPTYPQEQIGNKKDKPESLKSNIYAQMHKYAQMHRTLMIEGYRSTSIGTGLGFGNLCI